MQPTQAYITSTQRFKETPSEVFGRLVQCRTGHARISEYYHVDDREGGKSSVAVRSRTRSLRLWASSCREGHFIGRIVGVRKGLKRVEEVADKGENDLSKLHWSIETSVLCGTHHVLCLFRR